MVTSMVYADPDKFGILRIGQETKAHNTTGRKVERIIEVDVNTLEAWHVVQVADVRGLMRVQLRGKDLVNAETYYRTITK